MKIHIYNKKITDYVIFIQIMYNTYQLQYLL